eukprot:SAG11_NODE_1372_length_5095_cov_15.640312_5_plen_78_part_00
MARMAALKRTGRPKKQQVVSVVFSLAATTRPAVIGASIGSSRLPVVMTGLWRTPRPHSPAMIELKGGIKGVAFELLV